MDSTMSHTTSSAIKTLQAAFEPPQLQPRPMQSWRMRSDVQLPWSTSRIKSSISCKALSWLDWKMLFGSG
jgi:hypothetical protein